MKKTFQILLADDDQDYLFQMNMKLKKMGFEVTQASSQKEAEQLLAHFKPDLCIFDLMMEQDDSGFILCHKLKRRYPEVPVILATAVAAETGIRFDQPEDSFGMIKADLVVDKGIRTDFLEKEIEKLLQQQR
jgi:CheY-like chemotaxis protein